MIAADLLAQTFGLAVDRVIELRRHADKQANVETAVQSHRLVGQAVGILVERHRILPSQAFDRLKQASQNRKPQAPRRGHAGHRDWRRARRRLVRAAHFTAQAASRRACANGVAVCVAAPRL